MADARANRSQATDDANLGVEVRARRWRLVGRFLSLAALVFLILGFVYRPVPEPVLLDGKPLVVQPGGEPVMVIPPSADRKQKTFWFLAAISFITAWGCGSRAAELRERQQERDWKNLKKRIIHGD